MKIQAPLLTRDEFRAAVFERDKHRCVNCGAPAQDAHHIVERRLFEDGGYYVDNGASVCGPCHLRAESTELSCDRLRDLAGISRVILPEYLDHDNNYDKWGNILLPDGSVSPGPLWDDASVRKVFRKDVTVRQHRKYPRTPHLPWSNSRSKADIDTGIEHLVGREVVVTEKLDGENTTMYHDYIHARSIDSPGHPSRSYVKGIHAQIQGEIPFGYRIAGENLYARHSIEYRSLPGYFVGFSVFRNSVCLSWDDTVEWFDLLELPSAPILYRGIFDERAVRKCYSGKSKFGGEQEGYVVRVVDEFPERDFRHNVAKFVRSGHVTTIPHNWLRQKVVPNTLA
jgi:5-methylcytosine-specific restriction endonuclease McrA